MTRSVITLVALSTALIGCVPATQDSSVTATNLDDCFYPSEVTGFSPAGDDRIIVDAGPGDKYLFETLGSCSDVNWTENIAFDTRGSTRICRGLDVTLIVPTSIGPRRCAVKMISRVEPE